MKLQQISEDQLFELIRSQNKKETPETPSSKVVKSKKDSPMIEKVRLVQDAANKVVSVVDVDTKEINEKIKKQENTVQSKSILKSLPALDKSAMPENQQLWTVKYKPAKYSDIIGNKVQVDRIVEWLKNW